MRLYLLQLATNTACSITNKMAAAFGWKKKTPHDLSRKRAAVFIDSEENEEDSPKDPQMQSSNLFCKRSHTTESIEDRESVSRRLKDEGITFAEQKR